MYKIVRAVVLQQYENKPPTLQTTNPFCTKNYAQPYYDFKLLSNPAQIQPRRANKYSYYHKSSFDGITIRWTFKHVDFIRTYVQIRLEAQFVGGLMVLKDIIVISFVVKIPSY